MVLDSENMSLFRVLALLSLLSACSSQSFTVIPLAKSGQVLSTAEVYLDGQRVGEGETSISLSRNATGKVLVIKYPDFFPREIAVGNWLEERVVVTMEEDSAYQDTVAPKDLNVLVNSYSQFEFPGMHIANPLWRSHLRNLFDQFGMSLDIFDERSGTLQTEWRERLYPVGSGEQVVVRSRFKGRVVSAKPFRYQLKIQMERKEPASDQFVDWDRVYVDEAKMLKEFGVLG